jgi:hypothetical protein
LILKIKQNYYLNKSIMENSFVFKDEKGSRIVNFPKSTLSAILVEIKGTSGLVVHRFGEKMKKAILDKQMQKARSERKPRDSEVEYLDSIHFFHDKKRSGFPAVGFKSAMIRAGKLLDYKMTDLRQAIFIETDEGELVEIIGKPRKREDIIRVANGAPDFRWRAEYPNWRVFLRVKFNTRLLSVECVLQLLTEAGIGVGIGEWRPERNGIKGTWEVIGCKQI